MDTKTPEMLVKAFFDNVWTPPHDLSAIDELMTEDYQITTAGKLISGRAAFKAWVAGFHQVLTQATTKSLAMFSDQGQSQVACRWVCTGINNGILGTKPDQRPVSFTGIAIWQVRRGRLAECWVERSAHELYQTLTE